jgi:hypothetical protein
MCSIEMAESFLLKIKKVRHLFFLPKFHRKKILFRDKPKTVDFLAQRTVVQVS